jgi:AhpD family alkylhydroperoxidase
MPTSETAPQADSTSSAGAAECLVALNHLGDHLAKARGARMLAISGSIWLAARRHLCTLQTPRDEDEAMTDHGHYAGVLGELNPQHRALRQMIPDVYKGFGELSRAALAAGAVESKMKELMAMVIGVVLGCDGCIASHARGAVRAGATKQEAAEVIGVSIMMHGGPATIYGARAYTAFCEFADDTAGPSTQQ